jgi:hypothetical protein
MLKSPITYVFLSVTHDIGCSEHPGNTILDCDPALQISLLTVRYTNPFMHLGISTVTQTCDHIHMSLLAQTVGPCDMRLLGHCVCLQMWRSGGIMFTSHFAAISFV